LVLNGDAHHSGCEGELRMWPLPVIERARRQDSKIGAPSPSRRLFAPSRGAGGARLGSRVPRKVSQVEDSPCVLIDEETWEAIGDPDTVDCIARRLFVLKEVINGKPGVAKQAAEIIQSNIEAAYLHTDAHKAALKLYLLSLTGHLKPRDEPLQLINGAIERGIAQMEAARKGRTRKTGRG
jgi:hypothetical protein